MNVHDFAIVVNPYDFYYGCKVQIIGVQTDFYGTITAYTAHLLRHSQENEAILQQCSKKMLKTLKHCDLKDYPAIDLHYFSPRCWRLKIYSQMQLL